MLKGASTEYRWIYFVPNVSSSLSLSALVHSVLHAPKCWLVYFLIIERLSLFSANADVYTLSWAQQRPRALRWQQFEHLLNLFQPPVRVNCFEKAWGSTTNYMSPGVLILIAQDRRMCKSHSWVSAKGWLWRSDPKAEAKHKHWLTKSHIRENETPVVGLRQILLETSQLSLLATTLHLFHM